MLLLLCPAFAATDCIPIEAAAQHIGEVRCVTGRVVHVKRGARSVMFFDFCEDYRVCPFTVIVFPSALKDVGDVRQLEGKVIEVQGPVKEYDGRAEIVLQRIGQISGGAALVPPLPKNFDVENKGRYSAGKFSLPKAGKTPAKKRQTAKLPIEVAREPDAEPNTGPNTGSDQGADLNGPP